MTRQGSFTGRWHRYRQAGSWLGMSDESGYENIQVGPGIDLGKVSSYSFSMPRRKEGTLLPLELRVLEIAKEAQSDRKPMYGFALASALSGDGGKSLTGHGTLYKALARMADAGLLETEWEDPEIAETERRPRRRHYCISSKGVAALHASHPAPATAPRPLATLRPVRSLRHRDFENHVGSPPMGRLLHKLRAGERGARKTSRTPL